MVAIQFEFNNELGFPFVRMDDIQGICFDSMQLKKMSTRKKEN